jgi:anti-anti-sigma factor
LTVVMAHPIPTGRAATVSLIGDIDIGNAATHGDLLCRLVDLGHPPTLVVDCRRLDFIDSLGMAMMHRVHRHGVTRGTQVRWTGMSPRLCRLLQLTGLAGHLDVEPAETNDLVPREHPPD